MVKTALAVLLTVLVGCIVVLACVPPVSRDALTHHLAVPKLYLKHGAIEEIPSLVFSYYPMNLDLLYLVPLFLGNDIVPKYIHFAFALLTAGLIWGYLRHRLSKNYALGGVLFFLSLPIIVQLSITVYVDLGLIFFSTASLLYLLRWIDEGFRLRFLVLSAVFCGLGLGTKYNGLITFLLLSFFVPLGYLRLRSDRDAEFREREGANRYPARRTDSMATVREAVGFTVLFVAVALLVFSPWMIRNYMWTGNPIYPLYNGWLGAHVGSVWTSSYSLNHFVLRKLVFGESLWKIILVPIRIFFEGRDDLPQHFDGVLNPFLLFLPLLAFINFKGNRAVARSEKFILAAFSAFFLLFVFFRTDMRIRYVSPIIPPLVILAMYGVHEIQQVIKRRMADRRPWAAETCFVLLLAVPLLINADYVVGQFKLVKPFSYIGGEVTRDDYITQFRPEYPLIQWSNSHLPGGSMIMCLFVGNRQYYSDQQMRSGDHFFVTTAKKADSADLLAQRLKKEGVTHLMIRIDLFDDTLGRQTTESQKEIIQTFLKEHLITLYSDRGYGLFQLH